MKRLVFLILALVFVVTTAEAQLLTYEDSLSDRSITRSVGSVTSFKTYWFGPYDVSDCWVVRNVPGVATQVDTVVFRGYFTGMINYAAGDTMLGRWKAYLSEYPYPPQNTSGTTTWSFNWNSSNADSLISWKVRPANDFVSSSRDGYPVHSRFEIATVATDTIAYTNLFIVLELDSVADKTPAAASRLDFDGYWRYHCVKK